MPDKRGLVAGIYIIFPMIWLTIVWLMTWTWKIWPKKICISSHLNGHLIFCVIRILEKDGRSNNILAIPSTNRILQNSNRAQCGNFWDYSRQHFCWIDAFVERLYQGQGRGNTLVTFYRGDQRQCLAEKTNWVKRSVGAEGHEALSRTMLVFSGNWDDTHRGVICLKTTSRRGPSTLTLVVRDALMMVVR